MVLAGSGAGIRASVRMLSTVTAGIALGVTAPHRPLFQTRPAALVALTSATMKVAVMIEAQEGLTWEHWFRIADRVEELGLDSLWRSDHFFSLSGDLRRPALECWTSLTALAQRTRRIRFGPLVSPMTFRHPALLARMAAAVDVLSGGRLVRMVAREADEWNSHAHPPDVYRVKRAKLEEHCRAVGRDPETIRRSWMGGALIGRDANELAEKGRWMQSFLGGLSGVPTADAPDELRRRGWIVGTPDHAASQLSAWSALGIERVMFQWYNLDDLDGLALLAQLNQP